MLEGKVKGYVVAGENPAVGSANAAGSASGPRATRLARRARLSEIETAAFWHDSPEIESGELKPEEIGAEVFFMPAASHLEKDGSFTNTQRLLQWHFKAVEPKGDCRSELWFYFHLGRKLRARLQESNDPKDAPLQHLTWEYPTLGEDERTGGGSRARRDHGT